MCSKIHTVNIQMLILALMSSSVVPVQRDVEKALEYVFKARDNCVWGTLKPLPLGFDTSTWSKFTEPALRSANLLSRLLVQSGGTLDSVDDRMIFHMVANNVQDDSLIFGSAIGFEKYVFSKYKVFCPYAYKENGTVRSHDLASNYNCHDPRAEWYNIPKNKHYTNLTCVVDKAIYRNNDSYYPEVEEVFPMAELADGYWTKPYYDCGGGEIWMVTYSAPFFKMETGAPVFQGVVTVDIELDKIDINQCDPEEDNLLSALDIFMGSHRCQPTTKCMPITGRGFVTGAYNCICKDGFYSPKKNANSFSGAEIEQYYRDNGNETFDMYQCVPCKPGCDTCIDGSPCIYERIVIAQITLISLMAATVIGIICASVFTYIYRGNLVIKTASPVFLQLMCLGGVIMTGQFFLFYPEATVKVCYIRIWPAHVGFFIMYGSLLLKTWRISVIFTDGTHKRVRLPDKVLLQRFCLLVITSLGMLTAWTLAGPPKVRIITVPGGLKFYECDFGTWQHVALGIEIVFLLYGAYLCFSVRKVPAYFNESQHITWAVYNAIILGTFMAFLPNLVISTTGPTLGLLLEFIRIQVYVTVALTLIFAPKILALYKKTEDFCQKNDTSLPAGNAIVTITGAKKTPKLNKITSGICKSSDDS